MIFAGLIGDVVSLILIVGVVIGLILALIVSALKKGIMVLSW